MNKNQTTWLACSLLLMGQATCAIGTARAGDFEVKDATGGKEMTNTSGEGNFGRQKFTLTLDTRFGYDDNVLARPDTATVLVTPVPGAAPLLRTVDVDQEDSAFFNFVLGVGYTAASPRASLTVGADVGVTYYFDRQGRDYDINGGLSGRFTYKLTPRAFFDISTYNAYVSAGDYGASNLSGFNGANGVSTGVPGTSQGLNSDYFYTTDRVALSYQFAPRLSVVGSQNIVAFAYDEDLYSQASDRIETYSSLELQYLLQPNLTLAGTYRFGYVDYFNVSSDSQNHFVLGGVDYSFSQKLKATVRAGVQFREYLNSNVGSGSDGDEASPYAEGSITYDISRNSHLSLSGRYGIEEGVLFANATSKSNTFRIGTDFTQNFTARISGYAAFYYTHAQYQTLGNGGIGNFEENTYDVSAGVRYAINRHLAAEVGYTHTTFDSNADIFDRSYDRNRYFGGLRVQF